MSQRAHQPHGDGGGRHAQHLADFLVAVVTGELQGEQFAVPRLEFPEGRQEAPHPLAFEQALLRVLPGRSELTDVFEAQRRRSPASLGPVVIDDGGTGDPEQPEPLPTLGGRCLAVPVGLQVDTADEFLRRRRVGDLRPYKGVDLANIPL